LIYLDTSAFLKSVWEEPQSAALARAIDDRPVVSSALLRVEARRATLRVAAELLPRTDVLLADVTQIEIGTAVLESAGRLPDRYLRTLDAIHLATALLLRDELGVLLTYDERLADAARAHDVPVAAPGS
jgi:uncharacterized protein